MKKSLYVFGCVSAMLLSIGLLFKLMHWPIANVLIVLSVSVFNLIVLPVWLMAKIKNA